MNSHLKTATSRTLKNVEYWRHEEHRLEVALADAKKEHKSAEAAWHNLRHEALVQLLRELDDNA